MVSDTWSTDVLASDSETVEQNSERNFPTNTTDGAVNQLAETQVSLYQEKLHRAEPLKSQYLTSTPLDLLC